MLDKRELATEFAKITGMASQETQADLALRSVLQHMDAGNVEWGPSMMKINKLLADQWDYKQKHNPVPETVQRRIDELTAWLENLDIEPGGPKQTHCAKLKLDPHRLASYRCTHCAIPSAALRKCKCGQVR